MVEPHSRWCTGQVLRRCFRRGVSRAGLQAGGCVRDGAREGRGLGSAYVWAFRGGV